MRNDLQSALVHLCKARTLIRRHLSQFLYPLLHEDLDYDITSLRTLITALDEGKPIPGSTSRPSNKRKPRPPGTAHHGHEDLQP